MCFVPAIERMQCHPGKVHTYVDSLAAMLFFGVLAILMSSIIIKCHAYEQREHAL